MTRKERSGPTPDIVRAATNRSIASTSVPPLSAGIISAYTYVAPPCAGRTQGQAMVLRCGWCGGGHVHRAEDHNALLAGDVVRRCPVTGRRYRLAPASPLGQPSQPIMLPRQRLATA